MSDGRLACTIHPIGASDAALVASVRQELIGRGVFIRDTPSGVATSTALSVCVNPDESALAIVARLAEQCRRVLVVVGAPVTAPGLIWRLLALGASDVLSWQPRYEPGAAVLRRL
ncbi:MAG: hypothetical protein ACRDTT_09700, partial [Pseudonocardiaceae bacterium]